jgi:hypothetical protein
VVCQPGLHQHYHVLVAAVGTIVVTMTVTVCQPGLHQHYRVLVAAVGVIVVNMTVTGAPQPGGCVEWAPLCPALTHQ